MYLVFVDESGSPYVSYQRFRDQYEKRVQAAAHGPMPPYPFLVLAAVGIEECHLAVVDEWFAGIKKSFLGSVGAAAQQEYEIKGDILYSLRRGEVPKSWCGKRKQKGHVELQKAAWRSLEDWQLEELEKSVFSLMGRLSLPIWAIVVKQRHIFTKFGHRTWPPYYWALTYLQQRVAHHVQALHGAYQRAMFLMDETSTLRSAAHFDEYLSVRSTINSTAPWPVDFGRYLVDIPVFGQSHLHQALQIADVVAHAVWRHIRNDDPLGWFQQIEPLLAKHWTTGAYQNAGLTFIQ